MMGNNDGSQIRPHPISRALVNPEIPMSSFRDRLEALCPRNGNGTHGQVVETNPPMGAKLSNLLLLELL